MCFGGFYKSLHVTPKGVRTLHTESTHGLPLIYLIIWGRGWAKSDSDQGFLQALQLGGPSWRCSGDHMWCC